MNYYWFYDVFIAIGMFSIVFLEFHFVIEYMYSSLDWHYGLDFSLFRSLWYKIVLVFLWVYFCLGCFPFDLQCNTELRYRLAFNKSRNREKKKKKTNIALLPKERKKTRKKERDIFLYYDSNRIFLTSDYFLRLFRWQYLHSESSRSCNLSPLNRSVLHYAVLSSSIPIVNLLLKQGAQVNFEAEYNKPTPLDLAILKGDVELVRLLLDNGESFSLFFSLFFRENLMTKT